MPFGPGFDLLDIGAAAQRLDRHHLQQMFDLGRQLAETIDQFGGEAVDVALVLDLRKPPIEREPHRQVGDIILRDQQRPCRW